MKMILAGNRQQYEHYLAANGLTDSEARYVFDERSALGYGHDYEIVETGTYWEAIHYRELKDFLLERQDKSN